jgi:hypothetical protein
MVFYALPIPTWFFWTPVAIDIADTADDMTP